jgi:hypothetical protein
MIKRQFVILCKFRMDNVSFVSNMQKMHVPCKIVHEFESLSIMQIVHVSVIFCMYKAIFAWSIQDAIHI